MVGPSARNATPPGALAGAERPKALAPRALAALSALTLGLAFASSNAALALRLAASSVALAALAISLALPWSIACLAYLDWYAPRWLARGARPALNLLSSPPSVTVGLAAVVAWRQVAPAAGGALTPASLALGALAVPALTARSDRLLASAAPLREAVLAVGARPLAAFALVVWPAVRPHTARTLAEMAVKLTGEAALVVVARALGAPAPTLASALSEWSAAYGPLTLLLLSLSLALTSLTVALRGAACALPPRAS